MKLLGYYIHGDAMWLDWMSNGMMSIGKSYMDKQWDVGTTASIDSIVLSLLT